MTGRERVAVVALAVSLVASGILLVLAASAGNAVAVVVWGLMVVVLCIHVWLRRRREPSHSPS